MLRRFLIRIGLHGKFVLLIICWLLILLGATVTAITATNGGQLTRIQTDWSNSPMRQIYFNLTFEF